MAILSGDAAAITAYKYIETCEDPYLRRVIDGFNQVAMDVCKGQQMSAAGGRRHCVDVSDDKVRVLHHR